MSILFILLMMYLIACSDDSGETGLYTFLLFLLALSCIR